MVLLSSCVKEEVERVGKIKFVIETISISAKEAKFKIYNEPMAADGKVVLQYAYAYPAKEGFLNQYIDGKWVENYSGSYISYTDDSDVGIIDFRTSYMGLKPGTKYNLRVRGAILSKDANPNIAIGAGDEPTYHRPNSSDDIIMNTRFEYDVPNFSFTTLYE